MFPDTAMSRIMPRVTDYLNAFTQSILHQNQPLLVIHGAAIGGANGLLAACDIAVCDNETIFSLSEVKIGIVPACISPYVIKRVGEYGARELMLTGRRINGTEAENYKLVNKSVPSDQVDEYVDQMVQMLLTSGPVAITHCKNLIDKVVNHIDLNEALTYTAKMIAEIRASEEGQEGMAAFLEKRKPKWVKIEWWMYDVGCLMSDMRICNVGLKE